MVMRRNFIDPITLEVLRNALESIADEMGAVLKRTSFSPNIKERMDASCAIFDAEAQLVAQAEHVPDRKSVVAGKSGDLGVTGVQTCALPICAEPHLVLTEHQGADGRFLRYLRRRGAARRAGRACTRSEERRGGKEWRSRCDWSSDVCSSDLC